MTDIPFRAGFLLYPHVTLLDVAGPAQVFSEMSDAEVRFISATREPVPTDAGVHLLPTDDFDSCPTLDLLCVPGGPGQRRYLQDRELLRWVFERGASARYLVGVCSGSLLLGAAGLTRGRTIGTHWAYRQHIPSVGAAASSARVVTDGHLHTGGGVTAGIDVALTVVADIRGRDEAEAIQLLLEYAPEPPFRTGRPETSSPATIARARAMLVANEQEAARSAEPA